MNLNALRALSSLTFAATYASQPVGAEGIMGVYFAYQKCISGTKFNAKAHFLQQYTKAGGTFAQTILGVFISPKNTRSFLAKRRLFMGEQKA